MLAQQGPTLEPHSSPQTTGFSSPHKEKSLLTAEATETVDTQSRQLFVEETSSYFFIYLKNKTKQKTFGGEF
jgi:hypothetical protein